MSLILWSNWGTTCWQTSAKVNRLHRTACNRSIADGWRFHTNFFQFAMFTYKGWFRLCISVSSATISFMITSVVGTRFGRVLIFKFCWTTWHVSVVVGRWGPVSTVLFPDKTWGCLLGLAWACIWRVGSRGFLVTSWRRKQLWTTCCWCMIYLVMCLWHLTYPFCRNGYRVGNILLYHFLWAANFAEMSWFCSGWWVSFSSFRRNLMFSPSCTFTWR